MTPAGADRGSPRARRRRPACSESLAVAGAVAVVGLALLLLMMRGCS